MARIRIGTRVVVGDLRGVVVGHRPQGMVDIQVDGRDFIARKHESALRRLNPQKGSPPSRVRREVEKMLHDPPSSWKALYQRAGLPARPSADDFIDIVRSKTPSGRSAEAHYGQEMGEGRHVPPKAVREAALHGLRLSYDNNYTSQSGVGLARAVQLVLAPSIDDLAKTRMRAYLTRHERDKQGKNFGNDQKPSNGYMAWLNWGGDPAKEWLNMRNNPIFGFGRKKASRKDPQKSFQKAIDLYHKSKKRADEALILALNKRGDGHAWYWLPARQGLGMRAFESAGRSYVPKRYITAEDPTQDVINNLMSYRNAADITYVTIDTFTDKVTGPFKGSDILPAARSNPVRDGVDIYDPSKEQLRAVAQGVYENLMARHLGVKSIYTNTRRRRDVAAYDQGNLSQAEVREILGRAYAIATRAEQKAGRLYGGSNTATLAGAMRSQDRMDDPAKRAQNQQDHEITLALARKSSRPSQMSYRIVEKGRGKNRRYFVEPHGPGVKKSGYVSRTWAEKARDRLELRANPLTSVRPWSQTDMVSIGTGILSEPKQVYLIPSVIQADGTFVPAKGWPQVDAGALRDVETIALPVGRATPDGDKPFDDRQALGLDFDLDTFQFIRTKPKRKLKPVWAQVDAAFEQVREALKKGKNVVRPGRSLSESIGGPAPKGFIAQEKGGNRRVEGPLFFPYLERQLTNLGSAAEMDSARSATQKRLNFRIKGVFRAPIMDGKKTLITRSDSRGLGVGDTAVLTLTGLPGETFTATYLGGGTLSEAIEAAGGWNKYARGTRAFKNDTGKAIIPTLPSGKRKRPTQEDFEFIKALPTDAVKSTPHVFRIKRQLGSEASRKLQDRYGKPQQIQPFSKYIPAAEKTGLSRGKRILSKNVPIEFAGRPLEVGDSVLRRDKNQPYTVVYAGEFTLPKAAKHFGGWPTFLGKSASTKTSPNALPNIPAKKKDGKVEEILKQYPLAKREAYRRLLDSDDTQHYYSVTPISSDMQYVAEAGRGPFGVDPLNPIGFGAELLAKLVNKIPKNVLDPSNQSLQREISRINTDVRNIRDPEERERVRDARIEEARLDARERFVERLQDPRKWDVSPVVTDALRDHGRAYIRGKYPIVAAPLVDSAVATRIKAWAESPEFASPVDSIGLGPEEENLLRRMYLAVARQISTDPFRRVVRTASDVALEARVEEALRTGIRTVPVAAGKAERAPAFQMGLAQGRSIRDRRMGKKRRIIREVRKAGEVRERSRGERRGEPDVFTAVGKGAGGADTVVYNTGPGSEQYNIPPNETYTGQITFDRDGESGSIKMFEFAGHKYYPNVPTGTRDRARVEGSGTPGRASAMMLLLGRPLHGTFTEEEDELLYFPLTVSEIQSALNDPSDKRMLFRAGRRGKQGVEGNFHALADIIVRYGIPPRERSQASSPPQIGPVQISDPETGERFETYALVGSGDNTKVTNAFAAAKQTLGLRRNPWTRWPEGLGLLADREGEDKKSHLVKKVPAPAAGKKRDRYAVFGPLSPFGTAGNPAIGSRQVRQYERDVRQWLKERIPRQEASVGRAVTPEDLLFAGEELSKDAPQPPEMVLYKSKKEAKQVAKMLDQRYKKKPQFETRFSRNAYAYYVKQARASGPDKGYCIAQALAEALRAQRLPVNRVVKPKGVDCTDLDQQLRADAKANQRGELEAISFANFPWKSLMGEAGAPKFMRRFFLVTPGNFERLKRGRAEIEDILFSSSFLDEQQQAYRLAQALGRTFARYSKLRRQGVSEDSPQWQSVNKAYGKIAGDITKWLKANNLSDYPAYVILGMKGKKPLESTDDGRRELVGPANAIRMKVRGGEPELEEIQVIREMGKIPSPYRTGNIVLDSVAALLEWKLKDSKAIPPIFRQFAQSYQRIALTEMEAQERGQRARIPAYEFAQARDMYTNLSKMFRFPYQRPLESLPEEERAAAVKARSKRISPKQKKVGRRKIQPTRLLRQASSALSQREVRLPGVGAPMEQFVVAAFGSIGRPEEVSQEAWSKALRTAEAIGKWCQQNGVLLRSNHNSGISFAFEKGANNAAEVYVPFPGFNPGDRSSAAVEVFDNPRAEGLVRQLLEDNEVAPPRDIGQLRRYARDVGMLLGSDLDQPANIVVCWMTQATESTVIPYLLAKRQDIKILNLASPKNSLDSVLSKLKKRLRRHNKALRS